MSKRIKIFVAAGWGSVARDAVVEACKEFGIPFLDRMALPTRDSIRTEGIKIVNHKTNSVLPESYVFLSTKASEDLPYTVTRCKAA